MRVGVVHNLSPGGAHRRLSEQIARFDAEVVEVCLGTATPIRDDARIVALAPNAPRVVRPLRIPLRYADFVALLMAWRRVAAMIRQLGVGVVYANPCRYLQAPAALLDHLPPSLYFCDEPRRVDNDPVATGSRNPVTRPVYGLLYAAERRIDQRAVIRATELATNSAFSAEQIGLVYGRPAEIIPLGIPEDCFDAQSRAPLHLLSVGALIPSKGHDLAIAAAASARRRWPVLVVAPSRDLAEETRLRGLASALGVELSLRVGITDRELAEAYAAAQATLYMAQREPLGLASLEAQAAGSPVIVAAEGGLPETLADGRSGWAVPRTPAAVGVKLDELEQPGVREAMSAAARAQVADATWARSARAVQVILERLAT